MRVALVGIPLKVPHLLLVSLRHGYHLSLIHGSRIASGQCVPGKATATLLTKAVVQAGEIQHARQERLCTTHGGQLGESLHVLKVLHRSEGIGILWAIAMKKKGQMMVRLERMLT